MEHQRDLEHFPEIYPELLENLNFKKLWEGDPVRNANGGDTYSVGSSYRVIGIMDYLMKGQIAAIRNGLRLSAQQAIKLFARRAGGDPIDPSFLTILCFHQVYDALAAGDFALARELSEHMGSSEAWEKKMCHPHVLAFGYCLKAFVEDSGDNEKRYRVEELRKKHFNSHFDGYVMMFDAILAKDSELGNAAALEIAKGHKKESKGRGQFALREDKFLSIWGIGMINLARSYGLDIEIDDPLIPADLLV